MQCFFLRFQVHQFHAVLMSQREQRLLKLNGLWTHQKIFVNLTYWVELESDREIKVKKGDIEEKEVQTVEIEDVQSHDCSLRILIFNKHTQQSSFEQESILSESCLL